VAIEMIAGIEGPQAIRLRGDILWAARKWREAAEQIELLYGERWKQFTPLADSERVDVLRAAIGYAMGDEPMGLARLREKYAAKMADTPDRHAFEVVSAPTGVDGQEFQDVARSVGGMNTLDAFLREMRARYPDAGAEQAEDEGDKTAPADQPPAAAIKMPAPAKVAPKGKPEASAPPKPPINAPGKPDPLPTGSIQTPRGVINRLPGPQPVYR
jgi:hypothetical protein